MLRCKSCNANGNHIKLINKCSECDNGPTEQVYVNELLHYATFHYGNSSKNNIKIVIKEKFSHQDIKDAKKVLSDLGVGVEISDGRCTSVHRSAVEADVANVMNGLDNLDKM